MALVGITGGPAAGKTTTLEVLKELGAAVVDSDRIVHDLYRDDAGLRRSVRLRWGASAFNDYGEIVRHWIADKVFTSAEEREWLNGEVHPRVRQRILNLDAHCGSTPLYCAVPLLFEVGWQDIMLATCAVWCPESWQRVRLLRRGWDENRLRKCLDAQMAAEEKLERADFGLINAGTRANLLNQCRRLRIRINELLAAEGPKLANERRIDDAEQ